mmetsp:Transcript_58396/g.139252  ORF Transcript_58396/g.139252 Transcript_58396/m.139252 type:complete len:97 (-) Transcript_58396:1127-1417(-)
MSGEFINATGSTRVGVKAGRSALVVLAGVLTGVGPDPNVVDLLGVTLLSASFSARLCVAARDKFVIRRASINEAASNCDAMDELVCQGDFPVVGFA